jgi:malate synthase
MLSDVLIRHLAASATPVPEVSGLAHIGPGGGLESAASLGFLAELCREMRPSLHRLLKQRKLDREFLDARVRACAELNREQGIGIESPEYVSVLGLEDGEGRVVIGPLRPDFNRAGGRPVAPLPEYLQGPHVTLFGPPDTAKMAINAMNAYHRKPAHEPAIVSRLLDSSPLSPFWGADHEDSKTPLRANLIEGGENLTACMEGTLRLDDYRLARDHLALPIKRFPGLALPSTFLFLDGEPVPLHLYDFALHLHRNWSRPRALVFYVPKLENEEEAAYVHDFIHAAERRIHALHPEYVPGTIRLMIVLENPRAILRAHEIMDALHPYFAGASLGWHDYLASAARLFKNDPQYRIPVKADPEIVIKHIQASHRLVAEVVGSRGGIKVGGMYGILPQAGDARSLQVTLRGFIRDVVTQLKRGLNGFWVAHPDFVRLGIALVIAWDKRAAGDPAPLRELVSELLPEEYRQETLMFVDGPDVAATDEMRTLLVADLAQSDTIANNDPEEIRYNVFQSLQYLTDWLCGNGCVALPTAISEIPVRVMDDLATAERSRWEVWHEVHHGRFPVEELVRIAHEELNFIRRDLSDSRKIVQVKWNERTRKWYPVALQLMLKLMTDPEPAEFATQLLLPFTVPRIRDAADPRQALERIDSGAIALHPPVRALDHYFELCGARRFARTMAELAVPSLEIARRIILSFSREEVLEAASFHGDIGQAGATLDARAAGEQAQVASAAEATRAELRTLGQAYLKRFGFKFLISAQGRTPAQLKAALEDRIKNDPDVELDHARAALWEITEKRLGHLENPLAGLARSHGIIGASIAINTPGTGGGPATQVLHVGESARGGRAVTDTTQFQLASLSKTLAAAFVMEYFRGRGVPLDTPINALLATTGSPYRIPGPQGAQVTLEHCLNHTALNMHYVKGIPGGAAPFRMPTALELLLGAAGYGPVETIGRPGESFSYSGGGFIVLEHLLEALEESRGGSLDALTSEFAGQLGLEHLSFDPLGRPGAGDRAATGYFDTGEPVPGGRLHFPSFAAGALGSSRDMALFLRHLTQAWSSLEGSGPISHDTAVRMLHGRDLGSRAFMGCLMGLGVFTLEAGPNRFAVHQGANEGFRALFLQCYRGPDQGKGMVILCNGDNRAVPFIAQSAQWLLRSLDVGGIDFSRLKTEFNSSGIRPEQLVNQGYKQLLFDAFEPDLAKPIPRTASSLRDPLAAFNLATRARIIDVSNERFARAENLISSWLPEFDPELFEPQGKVMDSWESVRHNPREFDHVLLELEAPSRVAYLSASTRFHDGNHPELIQVRGQTPQGEWLDLLPKRPAAGHALLELSLPDAVRSAVFVRVEARMYPDGGFSRLGLYAELPPEAARRFSGDAQFKRFPDAIPRSKKPLTLPYSPRTQPPRSKAGALVDYASQAQGGRILSASNEHYSPASQVISPFPPLHMFDGMESARSRQPGHHEEVVIGLGRAVRPSRVVLDFTFFVNNNPREVSVEGRLSEATGDGVWQTLAPVTPVKAYAGNQIAFEPAEAPLIDQVRVRTFPDGGINRIKVFAKAPVA